MLNQIKTKIVNLKGKATKVETSQAADILESLVIELEGLEQRVTSLERTHSKEPVPNPAGEPKAQLPKESKELPKLPVQFPTTPAS